MKKNKFLIAGLVTVFVALVSLTLVSSTFAKYVSSSAQTSTARVAKWGVQLATSGDGFTKTYVEDDATVSLENTVSAETEVLAPGTKGTFGTVSITGTPEVAARITYKAELTLTNWVVGTEYYCPVEITVKHDSTETTFKGTTYATADEFKAAVEAAINGLETKVKPGTDLSGVTEKLTVSWVWAFTGDDVKDTELGNATTLAQISLKLTTTVEQID